ncbi:amidase, partial [uncultured Jatrophihabitans sp.]|uniref:amidase n=1 Tax=uncultured Jatrophihabitans sp. TaxID=1610747 RepID=UPI0035CBE425
RRAGPPPRGGGGGGPPPPPGPPPGRRGRIWPVTATATELTHLSATELATMVRSGEVTSTEVVDAHIAVLERITALNAVAAQRFDAAREEAAAADQRVRAGDTDLPPWHGVPVTIKEMLGVAGMPHTGGYPHRRKFRETDDATVVARLRAAGGIVLAVGNTCGAFIWIESNNPIYGRVGNAYDAGRTAGGSTGGDGAIVGSGGAPVALGSDLGGSVRIPAYLNGVFGHLPSQGLVPLTGHFPVPEGEVRRMLYPGLLARRAADLAPLLRIVSGPDGVDEFVTERAHVGDPATVAIDGLPVTVSTHASTVPLRPVLRGALDDAAAELQTRGARVTEKPLRQMRWALAQFAAIASAELDLLTSWEGITASTNPAGRPRDPLLVRAPSAVLKLADVAPLRAVRTAAARRLIDSARQARDAVLEEIGDGVLLYPPFPRLAPRHRSTLGQPWLATNTAIFNLYGLPATQVPLGIGDAGLPLGAQVVARPGADHVCFAVALELERAFGGWVDPRDVRTRT